jgi:type III pantothenate kinase
MLVVIDVGNTNTVLGVFHKERLVHHWRLYTDAHKTSDEYGIVIRQLLDEIDLLPQAIVGVIIASVVPPLMRPLVEMSERYLGTRPKVVGPGIRTQMSILCENPREVGADRIVNAVAGFEKHHQGLIICDLGTATTLDVVTPKGEFLGGVITPGIGISAEALVQRTAKLPRIEIVKPPKVIGRNTVEAMQAGLFFGYVGLLQELIRRMKAELDFPVKVIATGGLAPLIVPECDLIQEIDPDLTLHGLRLLWERNAG